MKLPVALAYVDDLRLKPIQPISKGSYRMYAEVLPKDDTHRYVFHHV